jgi:hypothetical protein
LEISDSEGDIFDVGDVPLDSGSGTGIKGSNLKGNISEKTNNSINNSIDNINPRKNSDKRKNSDNGMNLNVNTNNLEIEPPSNSPLISPITPILPSPDAQVRL